MEIKEFGDLLMCGLCDEPLILIRDVSLDGRSDKEYDEWLCPECRQIATRERRSKRG